MSQSVWDYNTIGLRTESHMGSFFDFYINNTFFLMAPQYYFQFYSIYLNRCLSAYDGWIGGFHNRSVGLVPQRLLQSVATGLNNMLFAHGIDFSGEPGAYDFAVRWSKKHKFHKALKKAHKYAIAGGTSLLKVNKRGDELWVSAHRIDTFFPDFDAGGKVIGVKVYFDAIHNTSDKGPKETRHFGICEERYLKDFGEKDVFGKPIMRGVVRSSVYVAASSLQNEPQGRPQQVQSAGPKLVNWEELPRDVRNTIKENYPEIQIGKEQFLPFPRSIGCFAMRFTDDVPQVPQVPFGQPIGDILFTENWQYDQIKQFEKHEVYMARARALMPEEMWNKDDPDFENSALSDMFYQKVSSVNGDQDKVTPIQFLLRSEDIRGQKENIYKDCALKLNVSASSIASFLSEGAGARTATEIISERTKSDTFINGQISLNAPEINEMLELIMKFYIQQPVEIVLKAEDQAPHLERLKTNSDVFGAGNMSPRRFVMSTYKQLSQSEQDAEIKWLEDTAKAKAMMMSATVSSWGANSQSKAGDTKTDVQQ